MSTNNNTKPFNIGEKFPMEILQTGGIDDLFIWNSIILEYRELTKRETNTIKHGEVSMLLEAGGSASEVKLSFVNENEPPVHFEFNYDICKKIEVDLYSIRIGERDGVETNFMVMHPKTNVLLLKRTLLVDRRSSLLMTLIVLSHRTLAEIAGNQ